MNHPAAIHLLCGLGFVLILRQGRLASTPPAFGKLALPPAFRMLGVLLCAFIPGGRECVEAVALGHARSLATAGPKPVVAGDVAEKLQVIW